MGDLARKKYVRLARDLSNGGSDAVQADLKDRLGNVHRNKGEPTGAHNAQPIILFCSELVGGIVQVSDMDGGERGDMRLKLRLPYPPEQQFQGEVKGGQIHQSWEPIGRDLPLHR